MFELKQREYPLNMNSSINQSHRVNHYKMFISLHGKPYFLLPDVLKRWLSKKIALEYDLSRIIGKDHVSLSRKYHLNLRREMKDDIFQKNTRKYDVFFRSSEKKVFSIGQEASDDFSQEIHGNMIFSVYKCGCYKPGVTPPCQNKSRMALSHKNTPKGD